MPEEKYWPIVEEKHLRPAGDGVHCFYCRQAIGTQHAQDCVMVHRKVKIRYSYDIEISVPHSWKKENIEFQKNESSSCADNTVREVVRYMDRLNKQSGCLCGCQTAEYLDEVDNTPFIED